MAEDYFKSDEANFISKYFNAGKNEVKSNVKDKKKGNVKSSWTSAISFLIDNLLLQDVQSSQMIKDNPSGDLFIEDLIEDDLDIAEDLNVYLI